MKRRDFNKLLSFVGLLPFIKPALILAAENPLEVGRMYRLYCRRTGELIDIAACKSWYGHKFFKERIWAEPDNPQAQERWCIVPTNLIDVSYDEIAENEATKREWAEERKRMMATLRAAGIGL